jgi:hypothetical protein
MFSIFLTKGRSRIARFSWSSVSTYNSLNSESFRFLLSISSQISSFCGVLKVIIPTDLFTPVYLFSLSGISNISLNSAQEGLLIYLCRHPNSTAYKISRLNALNKTEILSEKLDDRTIRRGLEGLNSRKLIERSGKENSKPCRVTLAGFVYLILKRKLWKFNTMIWIFRNYSSNILFQRILYPYICEDTITRLKYFNSLSPVALFLHDYCTAIVSSVESTYIPENKDLMQLILASKGAPQDASKIKALIMFLKRKFNLDWLDNAKVISENNNALKIAFGSNSILISLYNSNTMAVLTVTEKRKRHQFDVVPDNDLMGNRSVMTREESLEFFLSAVITHLVPTFIFSLASNVPASSEDFRTLCKDKNFMRLFESTRNNFDKRHELFLKEQNTHSTV